ncbi:hypothetical protein ACP70R_013158 [Stipagrostis hirtigluma subsp. patula]
MSAFLKIGPNRALCWAGPVFHFVKRLPTLSDSHTSPPPPTASLPPPPPVRVAHRPPPPPGPPRVSEPAPVAAASLLPIGGGGRSLRWRRREGREVADLGRGEVAEVEEKGGAGGRRGEGEGRVREVAEVEGKRKGTQHLVSFTLCQLALDSYLYMDELLVNAMPPMSFAPCWK